MKWKKILLIGSILLLSGCTFVLENLPPDKVPPLPNEGAEAKLLRPVVPVGPRGGSGIGSATFYIAASNAGSTVKTHADYVCDGTAATGGDNVEIQAAIDAAAGDNADTPVKIILSEGFFWLSTPVVLSRDDITIEGAGWNLTRLVVANDADSHIFTFHDTGPVNAETHWITIRDLAADGNSTYGGYNGLGDDSNVAGSFMYGGQGADVILENLWIHNFFDTAIIIPTQWGWRIVNCIIEFNGMGAIDAGIGLIHPTKSATELHVINCKIIDNVGPAIVQEGALGKFISNHLRGGLTGAGAYGIELHGNSNVVANNTMPCFGENPLGNGNDNAAIYVNSLYNVITANQINVGTLECDGIYIASGAGPNIITGNYIQGAPSSSAEYIDNDGDATNILWPNYPLSYMTVPSNPQYGQHKFRIGSLTQAWFEFNTKEAPDFLRLVLGVGHATLGSGYFNIISSSDYLDDNDSFITGTTPYPTIRIFAPADGTNAINEDWIELYHDNTDGRIAIGSGKLKLGGFTALGDTAPAIKMVKITGTSPSEGQLASIAHGLADISKIIGAQVLVYNNSGNPIPPNFTSVANHEFDFFIDATYIRVYCIADSSSSIDTNTVTILITYEE